MVTIRDTEFKTVAESVKLDSRKRVILPKVLVKEGTTYNIGSNSVGQIILDPQVSISASEVWLFENPAAIASVRRGLADAAQGKVSKINLDTL